MTATLSRLKRNNAATSRYTMLHKFLPCRHWRMLAAEVRRLAPDVVVLVARRMPRLMDLLGLDFGPEAIVVSDLALPCMADTIKGKKAALRYIEWVAISLRGSLPATR